MTKNAEPETTVKSGEDAGKPSLSTFFGLSSFQWLAFFRRGLFYTYLSIYIRSYLGLSTTATSLYATVPMIFSAFFQMFVWGRLSDKHQKRRFFIVLGEIIAGILLLGIFWIHAQINNLLLAGYILIGGLGILEIFWSMSNIGWSSLISDLYSPKDRSKVMSQLTAIGGVGRIIGILIGGVLYDLNGARYEGWGFREGILFYITSTVIFLSILPILKVPQGGSHSEEVIARRRTEEVPPEIENSPVPLVKIFIIFIVGLAIINIGRNSISSIYSQYLDLETGFNVSPRALSYIANTRSAATILIGFVASNLSGWWGHRKTLIFGVIMAITAILITALTPNIIVIFIGSFLMGASEIIIMASSYAYASILIPYRKRAKLFGVYNATFFLSWGIGTTLFVAPIIDALLGQNFAEVLSYQVGFLVAAGITFIGFLILLGLEIKIRKAYQRQKHQDFTSE